jgi:hypothetical protein
MLRSSGRTSAVADVDRGSVGTGSGEAQTFPGAGQSPRKGRPYGTQKLPEATIITWSWTLVL